LGKSALITGASGQDGGYLIDLLQEQRYTIHALSRRPPTPASERAAIIWHQGAVTDPLFLQGLIDLAAPDEIYNLAAISRPSRSWEIPYETTQLNAQTRTFCYITDAIVGFLLTLTRGVSGEAYNIGNPLPEISMKDLVVMIEQVLGRPVAHNVIEYPDSYPADEPLRRCPDIRKARLQLKYEPRVKLEDGLRRFLTWTDQNYTGVN